MHAEICDLNMMMDGNYFDITHSFNIGSSTYHVLGLRKMRPTYGNNYYIFNCECDRSQTPKYASINLPKLRSSNEFEYRSNKTTSVRTTCQGHETTSTIDRNRPHTASQKRVTNDLKEIKETLTEMMKSEHQSLIASIRKDIHGEKQREVITTAKNEKQEILRFIETQKNSLEKLYEEHTNDILSRIELLKKTIIETSNIQHKQLQSIDQFQILITETIQREVEKAVVKHFDTSRSTSLDINTIKQLQNTLTETFEQCYITKTDDELKHLLLDQKQYLTDLIIKQQQTYTININEIKQLQTTVIETMKKFSTIHKDANNDNETLKQLFIEQRQYFTDLFTKQQQNSFSLDLIKETVINVLQEQNSSRTSTTAISTGMTNDLRPFKIAIKTEEFAHVFAKLHVNGDQYPYESHILCQRDLSQINVVNCFVSPPVKDKPYDLTIYAKTNNETEYQAAIFIQMSYLNVNEPVVFPQLYQSFIDHQCILIEPFRRYLKQNEQVLLQMIIPGANKINIHNGNDYIELNNDEYHNGRIKKYIQVQGNIHIYGQWNGQIDSLVCAFETN